MSKGTMTIKSSSISTTADYVNQEEGLTINLSYQEDAVTKTLKSLSGSVYKTADSSYAGNFNGTMQEGGDVEYSISGVKRKDMGVLFDCLTDIEEQIANKEENEL